MIGEKEAKIIAGQILLKRFGKEYLEENKKKIGIVLGRSKGKIRIYFDCYKQNFDEASSVEKDGGIYVEEKTFPKRILGVEIDLKDGSAKVVD